MAEPADCTKRILDKLDNLASEVSDLRVQVARVETKLESNPPAKPGLVRDGGITISGGAVGAAVLALIQHFAK
jgi:hypothetical protein